MANPTPDDALRDVNMPLAMIEAVDSGLCAQSAKDDAAHACMAYMRTHADRIRLALDTLARVEAAVVVKVCGSEYGASNTFLKVAVHGVHADGFSLRARYRLVLEESGI